MLGGNVLNCFAQLAEFFVLLFDAMLHPNLLINRIASIDSIHP
jgi:hypothetical protein